YPRKDREWSLERKIAEVRRAGFDGYMGKVPPLTPEVVARHGLPCWANQDLGSPAEVKPALQRLKATGVDVVNTQVGDHDTPVSVSVRLARHIMRVADELAMDVSIEMHRDTGTETPEKTFAIADGYQKAEGRLLKLNFDFSHFALTKGLRPPFYERLAVRPDLVQAANQIHLRPFNGHHCQIPVIDHRGKPTPEFGDWLEFVDQLFALWLAGAAPGRVLWACPEMIGGAYGLSVFPNNWVQAKVIAGELRTRWARRVRAWQPSQAAALAESVAS
ncbi:MAG: xylose isomerase, partial [Actinobacteria bacterium]|nr:xylose isomerase [Actinomycetota bacterium]